MTASAAADARTSISRKVGSVRASDRPFRSDIPMRNSLCPFPEPT
jgi:hypothetical protein